MVRTLSAVLLFFLSLSAAAQESRFGAQIEIRLIEVDVVVTDRDGNHVPGLTAADFELFEGRKRREISNFTEYRAAAETPAAPSVAAMPAAPVVAPEPRTIMILIDSLPRIGLVRSTVFRTLEPALSKMMRPGDRATVVFWDPGLQRPNVYLQMTTDIGQVKETLASLAKRYDAANHAAFVAADAQATADFFESGEDFAAQQGIAANAAPQIEMTDRVAGEMDLMRFRRKTRSLQRLLTSIGTVSGRKAVFYVSNDFAMPDGPSTRLAALALLEELTRAANAAGVTFYAVRPYVPNPDIGADLREPSSASMEAFQREIDTLGRLTEATGGTLDFGLTSVDLVGSRMGADLDSYYSLAYRAESDGKDRERRITVKAKNPAYRVRTRRSYVDKSNETIAKETLIARLFDNRGGSDLTFDLAAEQPKRQGRNRWLLPVRLTIPVGQLQFARERNESVALVKILVVAGNGIAEVTGVTENRLRVVEGKATERGFITYTFELLSDSRGADVSVGVFDERSGLIGVRTLENRTDL